MLWIGVTLPKETLRKTINLWAWWQGHSDLTAWQTKRENKTSRNIQNSLAD